MRNLGGTILVAALAFILVGLAGGQQPPFGGFGGFGGGGFADPVALIRNPQVKKELDITDEQLEKVPDAVRKALGSVLNEKQMARLWQIELQQRGSGAFLDPRVQKDLKITDEQVSNIKTITEESRKEIAAILKEAKGGNFQGMREKMTAARKETTEKLQGVLTAEQKKAWKQMLGEEFKLEQGFGFGGGAFRKGDFKKGDFKKKNKNDDME